MLPTLMAATLVARLDIVPVPVATLVPVMPSVAPLVAVRCTIACIALVVPVTPIRPVATVLPAVGVSSVAAVPTGAVTVPAPAAAMTVVTT